MTLVPGTTVGRYQILEPLGQGGMATVYKAFQPSLQREVALKVLRPGYAQDQEFRDRFEREAIAIAKLRHPNIVQVFDFEIAQSGEYVLAMEFLEGGTLKERLVDLASEGRGIDPAESVRIIAEVADALSYAHEKGIVHRDVKPSNVMLTQRDRAVVTDFGIARILGATSHTQTGVGIGTPEYMAPEQGQGQGIDHRADIYSLGALAYELLTGRVPYSADTPLAVVLAHIKDPLPLPSKVNPTIGKGVERALLKALAKDPAQRFESATAFADALRAGLAEDSKGGTVPTVVVRGAGAGAAGVRAAPAQRVAIAIPPVLARRPVQLAIAGALTLAIVAGAVLASGTLRPSSVAGPSTGQAAVPARGALIWQAKLDGTDVDVRSTSLGLLQDATASEVRYVPGAIEIVVNKAQGGRNLFLSNPSRETFVLELDVESRVGASLQLAWWGAAPDPKYRLSVDFGSGRMQFQHYRSPTSSDLAAAAIADAVRRATPVTIAVVVESGRFAAFADQRQITQAAPDGRITPTAAPINVFFSSTDPGTMRLTGIRMYELPPTATGPVVPAGGPGQASPPPAGLSFAAMHGPQIYAATLGSASDVTVVGPSGFVGVSSGTLIMSTPEAGRAVEVVLGPQLPTEFAAEMDVSFDAGASLRLAICVRSEGERKFCLTILGGSSAEMRYVQQGGDIGGAFGPSAPAQMAGRTSKVGIVVERSTFTVFLDDRAILQSSDPRIATSTLPLSLQVQRLASALDRTGSARISNVKLYASR